MTNGNQCLVENGANNFNYKLMEADSADDWGYNPDMTDTLAHAAVRTGNTELVQYLHDKGTVFDGSVKLEPNGATLRELAGPVDSVMHKYLVDNKIML